MFLPSCLTFASSGEEPQPLGEDELAKMRTKYNVADYNAFGKSLFSKADVSMDVLYLLVGGMLLKGENALISLIFVQCLYPILQFCKHTLHTFWFILP